jgi:hypothetical protein
MSCRTLDGVTPILLVEGLFAFWWIHRASGAARPAQRGRHVPTA